MPVILGFVGLVVAWLATSFDGGLPYILGVGGIWVSSIALVLSKVHRLLGGEHNAVFFLRTQMNNSN